MRLDKFVGMAGYRTKICVRDWSSREEIIKLLTGVNYSDLQNLMKEYDVKYYEVYNNILYVDAKKKED